VVRDLKVIHGTTGLFVAMPAKKRKDGSTKTSLTLERRDAPEDGAHRAGEYEKVAKCRLP